jgi:hypothetical protein
MIFSDEPYSSLDGDRTRSEFWILDFADEIALRFPQRAFHQAGFWILDFAARRVSRRKKTTRQRGARAEGSGGVRANLTLNQQSQSFDSLVER